jgi:hypothetical protein
VPFQCDTGDAGAPGTANSCAPDDDHKTDPCALCVQAHCCTEYSECFATDPGNQCGWGGPNDAGEIGCVQKCIQDGIAAQQPDDSDLRNGCFDKCSTNPTNTGSKDCGTLIGTQTNALIGCLTDSCHTECLGD